MDETRQPPRPDVAPRLWPAWVAMLEHLADGEWHERAGTVHAATTASDVQVKTVKNLLAHGDKTGLITRWSSRTEPRDRLTPDGFAELAAVRAITTTDQPREES